MTTFRSLAEPATSVGYARVSTGDQSLKAQIEDLKRAGVLAERIFHETISGAARRLPKRDLAVRMVCRDGWTLWITKLDRLGRSVRDVMQVAADIEDAGASIRTLDGTVNTADPLVGKLLFGMLAIVADFERSLIAQRTKRGMAARKAEGAVFGKKKIMTDAKVAKIKADLGKRDRDWQLKYTVEQVAKRHNVSATSINNHLRGYRTKVLKATLRGARPVQK